MESGSPGDNEVAVGKIRSMPTKKQAMGARGESLVIRRAWVIGVIALVAPMACTDPEREQEDGAEAVGQFEETSEALEQRDQPLDEQDLAILDRALELLSDSTRWDRNDDRECRPTDPGLSLFCALQQASFDVLGEYQHRRVALQEVRFAIEDLSGGEEFEHRLMDFNNSRPFATVRRALSLARERVASRLEADSGS